MQNADTLIRTKHHLPFIRPELVPRPRLQARIVEGLHYPLTLVIAPAGFGKTTLVTSCVSDCGMPVAWLSLDMDDNPAGRFLNYLIAALQAADNRIGSKAAQLMAGMQTAPPEAVMTSLINDLDNFNSEMVLVLDDYQFITSPAVHEQVSFLLEHCPPSFHLLIAARSDPPLPLARLRARAQMSELRAVDLRFSESEVGQFLNDIMGLSLDCGSIALLEKRTEGWISGLQMAALSMRDRKDVRGFIEGFSGTNRYILDYLLEETLAGLSPEIQRFLQLTSIVERLTAPLCDALLENDKRSMPGEEDGSPSHQPSASVLETVERENLFLVSLDDERIWFRYHHLFSDLLRARLQQTQPDWIPVLHRRASTWLELNGFIPEAIHHLCAVKDFGQAAELIERYGPARWVESDPSVVQMAEGLPREMLVTLPKIGFYRAWFLIIQGDIKKALPLLNDMARQYAGADSHNGQQWIQIMIALALAFLGQRSGDPAFDLPPNFEALDVIPAEELILRDVADILYCMTLGRRGEIDRSAEVAAKSLQRDKARRGSLAAPRREQAIPTLVSFLARTYLMQGRLHAAASLCHEYLDPIQENGMRFIYSAGNMNIVLGEVRYEWNSLQEAEKQIRDGLQANEPWVDIMSDAFGLLALTRVLCAKGDYTGAMQTVSKFETRLQDRSRPHEFEEDFRTLRVRVQLASGDLQNAIHWADQLHDDEDFHLHAERYRLTLARIRLAQGRHAEVEELLSENLPSIWAGNRITRQIEGSLLLAAALAGQRRLPEAYVLIEACLALGEPEGYRRIFLDVGETAREILATYLKSAAPGHILYAQKLLHTFSPSTEASPRGPQPGGLVEPLSARELEVLHLMSQGRTNSEIARQLVVAQGTIKAHAASIYRKLDVANRTEAVARARQLSILN